MKRIKKGVIIAACGAMLIGSIGCGARQSKMEVSTYSDSYNMKADRNAAPESADYYDIGMDYAAPAPATESVAMKEGGVYSGNIGGTMSESELLEVMSESNRKTIRTASLRLETLEYDALLVSLQNQIDAQGAYVEYAYEYGNDYYSKSRYAEYRVRVPQVKLDSFLNTLGNIATVVSKNIQEQDVTLEYVDTESRIKTLQIEQERLLELLKKADDLDSIIALERRLSEVRYQIESHTSQLRTYDNKITYSTVTLNISEVVRVTSPEPKTVWERISIGWDDMIYNIKTGVQDFFVWAVVNVLYLIFWIAVITVVVIFVVRKNKKRKIRKQQKAAAYEAKKDNETKMDTKE